MREARGVRLTDEQSKSLSLDEVMDRQDSWDEWEWNKKQFEFYHSAPFGAPVRKID